MIVLLHGWPGDPEDWRAVVPLLDDEVMVPELLWHPEPSAATLADRVAALIDEPAVVGGYDVGSRVAQALARVASGAGPGARARAAAARGRRPRAGRPARSSGTSRSTGSSWPSS